METLVDETVPDAPNPEDKPEGWRDPSEAPSETSPAEGAPTETEPEAPDSGEDTEELDMTELVQEVLEGKWGVGQARRLALSKAGYNVKEVEAAVTARLNRR